jgi:hypothetical protein
MVADFYYDKWKQLETPPWTQPQPIFPYQLVPNAPAPKIPTQEEIDEFYKLLERAKEYDKKNNEPHCELEEKKELLRALALKLGIEIKFP